MKRILALIDLSAATPGVIRLSRDMALAFKCELQLVHVVESTSDFVDEDPTEASPHADTARLRRREMHVLSVELKKEGVDVATHVVKSPVDQVGAKILEELARLAPDLIVMGSHGHGKLYELLCGSIADTVVRKAHVPVTLVAKPEGKHNLSKVIRQDVAGSKPES